MNPSIEAILRTTWFVPVLAAATVTLVGALAGPPTTARRPEPSGRSRRAHLLRRILRVGHAIPRVRRSPPNRSAAVDPSAIAAWVDELARHLRRGATLRAALVEVAPADSTLLDATSALRLRLNRGALVSSAAREWHAEVEPDPRPSGPAPRGRASACRHLASVATMLATSADVGGGVGEPLDRLAAALRQAAADELERAAESASARLSARVLTLVPFAVLGLLLVVDADVRAVATTPMGGGVVSAGVILNLLGGVWMRRVIGAAR